MNAVEFIMFSFFFNFRTYSLQSTGSNDSDEIPNGRVMHSTTYYMADQRVMAAGALKLDPLCKYAPI